MADTDSTDSTDGIAEGRAGTGADKVDREVLAVQVGLAGGARE